MNHTDPNIIELLGPPQAYFEVWPSGDMTDYDNVPIRVVYHTLRYEGKNENIVRIAMQTALEDIREMLRTFDCMRIIWWRTDVELKTEQWGQTTIYRARCRLGTTPILPNDFWARHATPEGLPTRVVE
jgi:hypothetical protein